MMGDRDIWPFGGRRALQYSTAHNTVFRVYVGGIGSGSGQGDGRERNFEWRVVGKCGINCGLLLYPLEHVFLVCSTPPPPRLFSR